MARDLRTLFSSNDRLESVEAFTNRHRQWEAVQAALTEHLAHLRAIDVEDLEAARNNLIVLYGVGGIGKTTLSRTLEAVLAGTVTRPVRWGPLSWPERPALLPIRVDLARSAGTDFERIILTIRAALAAHLGRPLPAFDLLLRRYWEHQHPGEPLEEYLSRGGLTARFGKALPGQVQSALGDVAQALLLPGTVGGAIGQITGALAQALREHRQTVRALAGCRRLADLLEAEPDIETLSYYPHALAWELNRLPASKATVPVILLDTMEETGTRTDRDLERLLQRLVWLMPTSFFVITGRSRLQWADPALEGQLDFTGPTAWPGLAAPAVPEPRTATPTGGGGGRQVLIGDFSAEDCADYLARRLVQGGRPLIDGELRAAICERSHGLPLYLDLAALRFLELRRTGRTPVAEDFGADFPALLTRTMADLTEAERHVLRSVSLLDAFDLDLATATAGLTHQAAAARLTERPLVREDAFGLWPYSLHALIRSTLRSADDATDDRWTEDDWRAAAARALTALGAQWAAGTGPDRRLLTGCLRQGLALARDHDLPLGWLTDAATAYAADYVWEPLPLPARDGAEQLATAADALVELLSTLARRQHEHRARTVDRLTRVLATGLLPDQLAEMALYFKAKAHRDLGQSAASRDGMRQVADGGGRYAPDAARGLAHLARAAGDFPTALATAETLGWPGRGHRVLGDIAFAHGDMERARDAYTAARTEAETHGNLGEQAIAQTHLALAIAFTDPLQAGDELALAEQLLAGLDQRATTLTAKIAGLVREAGGDLGDRGDLLRAEITAAGITAAAPLLELALAFHHTARAEETAAAAAIARLTELAQSGDHACYADIAHYLADRSTPADSVTRWAESVDTVRARWHQLALRRTGH